MFNPMTAISSVFIKSKIRGHELVSAFLMVITFILLFAASYMYFFTALASMAWLMLLAAGLYLLGTWIHYRLAEMWKELLVHVEAQEKQDQAVRDLNPHKK